MNEVMGLDRDVMGVVFVFFLMIFPLVGLGQAWDV